MPFDIAFTEEDFGVNEDRSWLKARKGMDTCRSVTLDVSTFSQYHIVHGAIPSGTILSKLNNGKYGPYVTSGSGSDIAEVGHLDTTATGGTFRLIVNGLTTGALAADVLDHAAIQAAIRALGADYAAVTAADAGGGVTTVTFTGVTAGDVVVAIDNDLATGGTVTYTQTTEGSVGGEGTAAGILFNTSPVGSKWARHGTINLATAADIGVPMLWEGIVRRASLPTFGGGNTDGVLDSAAEADLPHIRFED